jgi:tetratricopeptide (TPR) repeat protein
LSWPHSCALGEVEVRRLALACETGSAVTHQISQRDWFDELLSAELYRLFSDPVISALSTLLSFSRSGLLLARAGDLAQASADLDRAWRSLPCIEDEAARRLGAAFVNAAQAYLLYREGRFNDALACLRSAYLDDLYVEEHGVSVMLMHRVQLINNMVRIEARRGEREAASRFGTAVLTYLEKPASDAMARLAAPWSEGWRRSLADIPAPFVCQMHSQIASEHVLVGAVSWTAVNSLVPDVQVQLWAIVDAGLRSFRLHEVADEAERLLSRGAWPSIPMWRDAATRISAFIARSDSEAGGSS